MLAEGNDLALFIGLAAHDFDSCNTVCKLQCGLEAVGKATIDSSLLNESIDDDVNTVVFVPSEFVALL